MDNIKKESNDLPALVRVSTTAFENPLKSLKDTAISKIDEVCKIMLASLTTIRSNMNRTTSESGSYIVKAMLPVYAFASRCDAHILKAQGTTTTRSSS